VKSAYFCIFYRFLAKLTKKNFKKKIRKKNFKKNFQKKKFEFFFQKKRCARVHCEKKEKKVF